MSSGARVGRLRARLLERIVKAFAEADPYRAVTHNKGIMNGVSAVLLATGFDTWAVEEGAHACASLGGAYRPLSTWRRGADGGLVGRLEMPLSVGTVGGASTLTLWPGSTSSCLTWGAPWSLG